MLPSSVLEEDKAGREHRPKEWRPKGQHSAVYAKLYCGCRKHDTTILEQPFFMTLPLFQRNNDIFFRRQLVGESLDTAAIRRCAFGRHGG